MKRFAYVIAALLVFDWGTANALEHVILQQFTVVPGKMVTAQVSSKMINEIVTPFKNPKVISVTKKADIKEDGNSLYIRTNGEQFIQLLIKNEDKPSNTYSVVLLPADDVAGQTIELLASDSDLREQSSEEQVSEVGAPVTSDYLDTLRETLRATAQNRIPPGFQPNNDWRGKPLQVGPLFAEPKYRYVGSQYVVEVYIVSNRGKETAQADEASFSERGVKAAAFFPALILAPNEVTQLFRVVER